MIYTNKNKKKKMYENLPAVFEYARILKGSVQRVHLTYEEYLEYKESYESLCDRDRAEYAPPPKNSEGTFVIRSVTLTQ